MTVGMIGLGKLGLPAALAIESKGHTVIGFDINPSVDIYLRKRQIPYTEKDLQPLLNKTKLKLESVAEVVKSSDIIFCAVQTPHEPQFEGATPLPSRRKDFNYDYLRQAIATVADEAQSQKRYTTLVVISTCLPGTFERELEPLLNDYVSYVYSPQFIAMGTVLDDYLNPEFSLIGVYDARASESLQEFFKTIHDKPHLVTDVITAEAIKVSYNTFITMKTVLANTWGELAHKVGANVDDIYRAWSLSTDRLLSAKYLRAGVGDGGGCHPRDNIALSYLADKVGLSHNLFEDLMWSREDHMRWLAHEAVKESKASELPIVVLGRSFKPETNIETGSPAVLMASILKEMGYDPEHTEDKDILEPAVYVIGTMHERYKTYSFPTDSIVIDPFRYIPEREGVKILRIGG